MFDLLPGRTALRFGGLDTEIAGLPTNFHHCHSVQDAVQQSVARHCFEMGEADFVQPGIDPTRGGVSWIFRNDVLNSNGSGTNTGNLSPSEIEPLPSNTSANGHSINRRESVSDMALHCTSSDKSRHSENADASYTGSPQMNKRSHWTGKGSENVGPTKDHGLWSQHRPAKVGGESSRRKTERSEAGIPKAIRSPRHRERERVPRNNLRCSDDTDPESYLHSRSVRPVQARSFCKGSAIPAIYGYDENYPDPSSNVYVKKFRSAKEFVLFEMAMAKNEVYDVSCKGSVPNWSLTLQ